MWLGQETKICPIRYAVNTWKYIGIYFTYFLTEPGSTRLSQFPFTTVLLHIQTKTTRVTIITWASIAFVTPYPSDHRLLTHTVPSVVLHCFVSRRLLIFFFVLFRFLHFWSLHADATSALYRRTYFSTIGGTSLFNWWSFCCCFRRCRRPAIVNGFAFEFFFDRPASVL